MIYYHVTLSNNINNIRRKGLLLSNKRNVPLSKKNVIYIMGSLLEAGSFASRMEWETEEPVSIIKLTKLDNTKITPDLNIGAFVGKGGWFEYHDNIKPSQIGRIRPYNKKFIIEHAKRMNKT